MSTDKLAEKIPDIHFDWYARLIPGAVATAAYILLEQHEATIDGWHLLLYAAWAYVLGHTVQPLSSFIVGYVQQSHNVDEAAYTRAKLDPQWNRQTANISKAYAEAVGMLSTALLLAAVLALRCCKFTADSIITILMIYSAAAMVERVLSRKQKIDALKQ